MRTHITTILFALLLSIFTRSAVAESTTVPNVPFLRGDVNADDARDMTDSIEILAWLFLGTVEIKCLDTADLNDDGLVQLDDSINGLVWAFLGGTPPAPPTLSCGLDPSPDALSCAEYPHCESEEEPPLHGHHHDEDERPIELRWLGLDSPDDVVESSDSTVELLLINESHETLNVEVRVTVEVDGVAATSMIPVSTIEPHEKRTVSVQLAVDATLDLVNMRYAGNAMATYIARHDDGDEAGQGASEQLNFRESGVLESISDRSERPRRAKPCPRENRETRLPRSIRDSPCSGDRPSESPRPSHRHR